MVSYIAQAGLGQFEMRDRGAAARTTRGVVMCGSATRPNHTYHADGVKPCDRQSLILLRQMKPTLNLLPEFDRFAI